MIKNKIFRGAATALITPFSRGEVDYISLGRLIDFQIEQGIDALLINGTTGESSTLSEIERRALISYTVGKVAHRVPLLAGTGCNNTALALELSSFACDVGCDGVLVVTPYYNKATESGLIKHYTCIADRISKPLLLYNVPSRTGVSIPLSVYRELSRHENIAGVKEASASVADFGMIREACGEDFAIYSGNDDMILPSLSLGSDGVISVLSNLFPKEVALMCRHFFEGETKKSISLQLKFYRLIKALFSEVNPIPIKTALAHLKMCQNEFRLPLCEMNEQKKLALLTELDNLL